MGGLKTLFMGTPEFAIPTLRSLIASPLFNVGAVYTQPPKPMGRGYAVQKSPVHQLSDSHNILVLTPSSLKDDTLFKTYAAFEPDLVVVAAYGFILPKRYLDVPRYGCINVHASLLPRWRGAAPIQWAILAGDQRSGVSIMQMEPSMDTGPILFQKEVIIDRDMTGGELYQRLANMGGDMIVPTLEACVQKTVLPQAQPGEGATLAPKITKDDGRLVWLKEAETLRNTIRAFNPAPGAYFVHHGERIKVLKTDVVKPRQEPCIPGTVMNEHLHVQCGQGVLVPLILQRPGKKPLDVTDFLRGYSLPAGTRLE